MVIYGIKNIDWGEIKVRPYDMTGWFLSREITITTSAGEIIKIRLEGCNKSLSMDKQNEMLSFGEEQEHQSWRKYSMK